MTYSRQDLADPGDTSGERRYDVEAIVAATMHLLAGLGMPPDDAHAMAAALIDADMGRIRTHGLRLLPAYLRRLVAGAINPTPQVRVVRRDGAVSCLDGDDGFGQVVARRAVEHSLEVLAETGVAMTFVRGSNHLGALGYPARLAAERNTFAFVGQNTTDILLVPGGQRPAVGNSPFALAMPVADTDPMVLDISCSKVAKNNIYRAAERGEPIPDDIAVDRHGQPTTDPHEALQGAVLAFGGHKGAGLAMFIGALAGVVSGANFGPEVPRPTDYTRARDIGHFIFIVDLGRVMDAETHRARMAAYVANIHGSGPQVRVPGERSGHARREARRRGVLIPTYVLDDLASVAAEAAVPVRWPEPLDTA